MDAEAFRDQHDGRRRVQRRCAVDGCESCWSELALSGGAAALRGDQPADQLLVSSIAQDQPQVLRGELVLLLNIALSDLIARAAGQRAPIDFQIQSQSEANAIRGKRVPMGGRDASGWLPQDRPGVG